jgi:hypothetical protein
MGLVRIIVFRIETLLSIACGMIDKCFCECGFPWESELASSCGLSEVFDITGSDH